MRWISHRLSMAATGALPVRWPLRSTVTRSLMPSTSSRKWLMNTNDVPASSRTRRSMANSRAISGGERAEVGSSRMMRRAPEESTRANSTSCCSPIGS